MGAITDFIKDRFSGNQNALTKNPNSVGRSSDIDIPDIEPRISEETIPDITPSELNYSVEDISTESPRAKVKRQQLIKEISDDESFKRKPKKVKGTISDSGVINDMESDIPAPVNSYLDPDEMPDYGDILPVPVSSVIPETKTTELSSVEASVPTVNETTKSTGDIITTPDLPSVETSVPTGNETTTITDSLPQSQNSNDQNILDLLLNKIKSKQLITKEEAGKNLIGGIFRGESGGGSDLEYARKGGYKGDSKEILEFEIASFKIRNEQIRESIKRKNDEIDEKITIRDNKRKEANNTQNVALRAQLNSEIKTLNDEIALATKQRDDLANRIVNNEGEIRKRKALGIQYDESVRIGKRMPSERRSAFKKGLQNLGEGASDIQSGVYNARVGKNDWFGPKGFLSAPYKQSYMTRNVVEDVKPRMGNLNSITRSTGNIVGQGTINAATTVRASKLIAPLGVPGTVAGARQQFDYGIPVKKISLLEASGITRQNVNQDILPNLYESPRQLPVTQYKQIIQPDGSVVNVPVPTQQRRSKLFTVSVNRYPHIASKSNAVKSSKPIDHVNMIARGIKSVGSGNKFTRDAKNINLDVKNIKSVDTAFKITQLSRGIESIGSIKPISIVSLKTRKIINIGFPSNDVKVNVTSGPVIVDYRKAKKSSSLVNIGLDGIVLNKNLKKFVLKHKAK